MLAYLADSRLGIGPFVRPIKASVPPHKTVTIHSELDSLMNIHPSQQSLCLIFLTVWESMNSHIGKRQKARDLAILATSATCVPIAASPLSKKSAKSTTTRYLEPKAISSQLRRT
jgi:hypothetical protein